MNTCTLFAVDELTNALVIVAPDSSPLRYVMSLVLQIKRQNPAFVHALWNDADTTFY